MSKILVVDDSKMMSHCLHEWLGHAGFEVEEWLPLSATEVPEHITASAPDLILSDYQMPGCNGSSLMRMVKRTRPDLPVIILTAFKTKEMEADLLKLGVRRVLSKPIDGKTLIQSLQETLGTSLGKSL